MSLSDLTVSSEVPLIVKTTCAYCGVGCGVEARISHSLVEIAGDREHPANGGRLCSKGALLGDTLDLQHRLLRPAIRGRDVNWSEALDLVAGEWSRIIGQHGADATAFYVSGQMLTEDYYVANKLMKGFIGSGNIDTNSRLCMASSVVAHTRAFGSDTVPGCYEDLELADLIVVAGSNFSWCHPVLAQRLADARQRRSGLPKVVVIDPRRTETAETADLHLAIRTGTDATLFSGLLQHLLRNDKIDHAYLEVSTVGFGAAFEACFEQSIPAVSRVCGVTPENLVEFYTLFAQTEKTVTVFAQGIHQSSSGTDKISSILNVHLATGRIGKPGMGPFSLTGQINAMGGREVGGMATTLAAHMGFRNAGHREAVGEFWNSARIAERPGLKAVELFEALDAGTVKAVWIMATNPVVSLPDADFARRALAKAELVVLSECFRNTDTAPLAHVLFPAAAWGEKDGTVTNSERCISRQRGFLPLPGDARPDWWIICEVAKRMGFSSAFDFTGPSAIFREHARLSGFRNNGERDFNISGLADLNDQDYESLKPVRWPVLRGSMEGTDRMFADGRFFTPDGRARLIAVHPIGPANALSFEFPLILNTGRVRDQWHTMTRTGLAPRLLRHLSEPFVEMHLSDADRAGIAHEDLVSVETAYGRMIGRAIVSEGQKPGYLFVPFHWTDQFTKLGRVNSVVNPATDPLSGQPEFKHTPARVVPLNPACSGFLIARKEIEVGDAFYWARIPGNGSIRHEIADERPLEFWAKRVVEAMGIEDQDPAWLDYSDRGHKCYRGALIVEGRLEACVFLAESRSSLPPRAWLESLFIKESLTVQERLGLLAGWPRT